MKAISLFPLRGFISQLRSPASPISLLPLKSTPPSLTTPPPTAPPTAASISGDCLALTYAIYNCIKSRVLEITNTTSLATATATATVTGLGLDFWNRVKRRNNREPEYPDLIERLLFQDSGFQKYFLPVASIGLASMPALHLAGGGGGGVLKEVMPLLLKLAGGGVMCRYLGEEYQLICPELAVIAMIASKILGFASFYIVILNFLRDNPFCSLLVYLSGVMAVFPLVMVVVKVFKEDVRKAEEINGGAPITPSV